VNLAPRSDVTVYTTRLCGYCVAAKRLLSSRGIAYDEIDVTGDGAKRAWLVGETGRKTVPQVFIAGALVGGYAELAALDRSGRLAQMVGQIGAR
jgi:glutaredoxin 3